MTSASIRNITKPRNASMETTRVVVAAGTGGCVGEAVTTAVEAADLILDMVYSASRFLLPLPVASSQLEAGSWHREAD
jgi:hypothetical protein